MDNILTKFGSNLRRFNIDFFNDAYQKVEEGDQCLFLK